MPYITRDIESTILDVSRNYAAVMVVGPRQVGKTTTLRRLAESGRTEVTLDDMEARKLAKTDPEMFLSVYKPPLLIDEVQYAPELFSRIKIETDNGAAPGSYWMTGSQPFRLMRLVQESLAGRVALLHMPSLSQREIYYDAGPAAGSAGAPFSLDIAKLRERTAGRTSIETVRQYERIWTGSLPGHISGQYPQRDIFYSGYLQTYIGRDIKDMYAEADDLQFTDFIRAAACRTGQMLNIHDIALDVAVSDETAKRWLGLLEKSGVIFYLRPYSNNLLKRTVRTPKLYFFDTGLVSYLTKYSSPEILMNGAINGAILENYVVSEIVKSYANHGLEAICHYYRDKDSKEIDLVMESDGKLYPIEIKKTASPPTELARMFNILDKANMPRGTGAIICTKRELSAIDHSTLIVPVWAI
jgi:predicted AAA+ superfamily ATPase